jgi:hypothetical protein
VIDSAKQVGYIDITKTRYDHVGFGLVLQVMPGEEETKEVGKPAAGGKGKKVDKKEGEEEKKQ